jgi:large conductance mechanosensitive channel
MIAGFKKFILRGNVVDLAVGVIIGAAFGAIVKSMTEDIITPLIGALGGKPDFSSITLGPLFIGKFINAIIGFLIQACVVYFLIVVPMNRLMGFMKRDEKAPEPAMKDCPFCVTAIPVKAIRCPHCTSDLTAK